MTNKELFALGEANRTRDDSTLHGWEVDISSLAICAILQGLFVHIRRACDKHPIFVQPDKALDVLAEEVCEVKEALNAQDIPLVINELYDVATVALRWALRLYVEDKHHF